jgi:hypothetical protein
MDRLPGIRHPIADRTVGADFLEVGEELGKGLGDGRPVAVFLVIAVGAAQRRMNPDIALRYQVKPAMAGRRVEDDAIGVAGRRL